MAARKEKAIDNAGARAYEERVDKRSDLFKRAERTMLALVAHSAADNEREESAIDVRTRESRRRRFAREAGHGRTDSRYIKAVLGDYRSPDDGGPVFRPGTPGPLSSCLVGFPLDVFEEIVVSLEAKLAQLVKARGPLAT